MTHGSPVSSKYIAARPALERHDVERRADAELVVEEPRQLADRQAVAQRNRELADERRVRRVQQGAPSTASPPTGFGRSQTTTRTPCRAAARMQLAIV